MILEMFNSPGQPFDWHPVGAFVKYKILYLTKAPTGCQSTRLNKYHWNTNFRNNSGLSQKGYGTTAYGSVLPGFLPSFPSQIWVSDVTFVTFSSDKQCDASHLSHFWEECDALAHKYIFFNL